MPTINSLLHDVKKCSVCEKHLLHSVRPVLQVHPMASILIAGQAPGRKIHESGVPFDDASGDRLREWMGVSKEIFYDDKKIAILPMGFCYPGKGKNGDLPPRPECEPTWRKQFLDQLPNLKLTLVIGKYAQAYHLNDTHSTLTDMMKSWKSYWPNNIPLPHPSPRNNIWLSKNPWFEKDLLPVLRDRVATILAR